MKTHSGRAVWAFVLGMSILQAASAAPGPTHFTETWESYATGTTPYGPWELEAGSWGTLARPDADGAGRYHSAPTGQTVWLRRAVDLSAHDHVVLQGRRAAKPVGHAVLPPVPGRLPAPEIRFV